MPFAFMVAAAIAGFWVPPPWRAGVAASLFVAWLLFALFLGITGRRDRAARKSPGNVPQVARWFGR